MAFFKAFDTLELNFSGSLEKFQNQATPTLSLSLPLFPCPPDSRFREEGGASPLLPFSFHTHSPSPAHTLLELMNSFPP